MSWLSAPEGHVSQSGVLILPPIGYPYWSSHRTLRVLAESLAANGHIAMRLDYESTGDSAGGQWDPERVAAWRQSARVAAEELRGLGCRRLTVIGVRLGATTALLDGAELGAETVVAWSPVVSPRRYAKEIRLLSEVVPDSALPPGVDAALASAGTIFSDQTLEAISALDLTLTTTAPAARVLLLDASPLDEVTDRLRGLGSAVEQRQIVGGESALESPTEYATVPGEIVQAIRAWVGPAAPSDGELPAGRMRSHLSWGEEMLAEQIVELGPGRLIGILTEPEEPGTRAATVVFLNSGSEPHVGPGRAWVEYARELAGLGHRCLRVDFRGWGESPDDGHAPGRPYDAHCEQDTIAIVRSLRELGHERVVLVGLCASAWVALRAILIEPVAGVIALNPQLYWRPGDPVEATMEETRLRRTDERRREERGARLGLWSALDLLGSRPWPARWLDDLCSAGTPVAMVFAEGDDGIEYLRNRLRRRLRRVQRSGAVRVMEVPDIDHSMHRVWLRPAIAATLDEQVRRMAG
jgi:pimeloyl-ACP methyl ester carboxylesterase